MVDNLLKCFTFSPTQHTVSFETKSPMVNGKSPISEGRQTLLPPKNMKTELKSQQPWIVVSVLLGQMLMAQRADELWFSHDQYKGDGTWSIVLLANIFNSPLIALITSPGTNHGLT